MSFNGSGTFVINSAGQPVVANTVISATTFNALTADLANGLTTCITKDGQTTPTANIPMGGFKITNLATGTAATDAATVAQIQSNGAALVTVTGTDTLTGSLTPALVAYVTGAVYYFVAPATNTGAVTLNIDTLGAKNVTRDGTTALVAGDIVSGEMVAVVYDGTRFQLISPVNSFTNLNVSGTLTVAGATTLNGNLAVGDAAADTINFKSSGWTLTNNVSVTGTWADIGTITTADINGGTIDGTTIGGGTAAAGTFTTVGATTGNITTVNATTVDSTNLEVTNLKAKDGTAAGSIADATGVVTLNSLVATTADINGGTIDATTIGGSSPAVGNFTTVSAASAVFTTATITTVNTTTLDLTNLEVTNIKAKDGTASMTIDDATGKVNVTTVSAASMNAGVAAVTSLTATGASVASANVGTAVITNGTVTALTATGASIASMNAGVALLTTATVTNFTASGASIASANVGTAVITAATVTGASIASMNAGVALLTTATVTNLTATGASIASANVGTLALTRLDVAAASVASANAGVAVITTGTVTNLTSTSASIASMNAGVALLTTATVTNLTATGASVASANVGTAVITGLTVTGASIASVNAGVAVLSGNLTLNGGTANGVLYLNGSKVATSGSGFTYDGTSALISGGNLRVDRSTNTSTITLGGSPSANWEGDLIFATSNNQINWRIASNRVVSGALTFTPSTATGGSTFTTPAVTIDNASNVGIGTASPSYKLDVAGDARSNSWIGRANGSAPTADCAVFRPADNSLGFSTANTLRATIDSSGNLGLGVTPSLWGAGSQAMQNGGGSLFQYNNDRVFIGQNNYIDTSFADKFIGNGYATRYRQYQGTHAFFVSTASNSSGAGALATFTQAMTLDASGRLLVGTTTNNAGEALQVDANGVGASIYTAIFRNTSTSTSVYNAVRFNQGASGSATGYIGTGGSAVSNNAFANNFVVGTQSNSALVFNTNDTERGRFTAGGYFKASNDGTYVGSTSNYHEFRSSNNTYAAYITNTNASPLGTVIEYNNASPNGTGNVFLFCGDSTATRATIRSNGGLANYQANDVNLSDERTKKDIAPLGSMWAKFKAIEIVTFKYKDQTHDDDNIGVIAQQVESVAPEFIDTDGFGETPEDGVPLKTVYTTDMYHAAIKALQEAMARIESLEADVAALKGAK